jgi:hypothetical protein
VSVEYAVAWGGDPEDVFVTASGVASLEGLRAMTAAVITDPRFRPGQRCLLDYRRLDWSAMTVDDLRRRADAVVALHHQLAGCRIAIVVSGPAAYGVQRMMQAFREVPFDTDAFYTLEDARDWLRSLA